MAPHRDAQSRSRSRSQSQSHAHSSQSARTTPGQSRRSGSARGERSSSSRAYRGASRKSAQRTSIANDYRHQQKSRVTRESRVSQEREASSRRSRTSRDTSDERRYSAQSPASSSRKTSASDYSATRYTARKKRMSTGKKVAIGIVSVIALVVVGVGIAGALWYNTIANNIKGNGEITNLVAPAANEPYYVLLMGSDTREGWEWEVPDDGNEGERADSIMVARIDEKNQKVAILSIPRDLRVKIGNHGYKKINSAIEYGGYNELINELNALLGIKINYYATVNFMSFIGLVDTLGGINVAVPEGTATQGGEEILPVGDDVLLDGDQALILARCRHGWPLDQGVYAMGDYQRTLNQRNVIKAIAKKVLQQDITKMPALIEALSQSIETNMGIDKIITLAQVMKGMDVDGMESAQLPIGASTINGGWEALVYQDVYERMLANFTSGAPLFEGLDNFDTQANDDDVHGNYIDGPVYAYTTYSARYGSPYSDGYQPSSFTQDAIDRIRAGVTH